MAKKKTAVKTPVLKAPILRQALSAVKTAIIHFSDDHILAIGYNPTSKETVMTDIPQNLTSQFTLGEGGGGGLPIKTIDVTFVNNSGSSAVIDGFLKTDETHGIEATYIEVENGQSIDVSVLAYYSFSYFIADLTDFGAGTPSDYVNCSQGSTPYTFKIIDSTSPASFTITLS